MVNRMHVPVTVPKQHGAWSILVASFLLGTFAGSPAAGRAMWLLAALLTGFIGQATAASALRPAEVRRRQRLLAAAGLLGMSLLCLAHLVAREGLPGVVPLGGAMAGASVIAAWLERRRKAFTMSAELLATSSLSLVVLLAVYVRQGSLTVRDVALWISAGLFFCGSVFHVRFLVRGLPQRRLGAGPRLAAAAASIGYHLAAVIVAAVLVRLGRLPALSLAAWMPVLLKVAWGAARPPEGAFSIRRIGLTELAHTSAFVLLTLWALTTPR